MSRRHESVFVRIFWIAKTVDSRIRPFSGDHCEFSVVTFKVYNLRAAIALRVLARV